MNKCTILCIGDDTSDHGDHHIGNAYNVAFSIRKQLIKYFPDYNVVVIKDGFEALVAVANYLAEGREIPLVIADQMMSDIRRRISYRTARSPSRNCQNNFD